jgi:hypothetical protein
LTISSATLYPIALEFLPVDASRRAKAHDAAVAIKSQA